MSDEDLTATHGGAAATAIPDVSGKRIGDFKLVRQIGRGGMGIVYEAEQVSLGRRVALKVLPTASAMDARHLRRFRNEAQAAANLHHTHVVPVFAVGQDRDVHYYAMQFIDGRSLAEVIRDMARQQRRGLEPVPHPHTISTMRSDQQMAVSFQDSARAPGTDSQAPLSSGGSSASSGYFRTVAQIGIDAAEALEHAHEMGVLHRDIKPANLMLEPAPSAVGGYRVWVTDFGLAQMADQPGMTISGDLIGTMRYMSPEQALAKRVPVDHRTDIYSLGVTLYELLALQPAFGGEDRREVLLAITTKEPTPPRKINPAVPRDLETIILKAMSKSPSDRYATARDLAEDLKNFTQDKAIAARRPTAATKLRKWAWRHRVPVAIACVGLFLTLTVGGGALGYIYRGRIAREAYYTDAVERDVGAILGLMAEGNWVEARGVLVRLRAFLDSREGGPAVDERLEGIGRDLKLQEAIEKLNLWGEPNHYPASELPPIGENVRLELYSYDVIRFWQETSLSLRDLYLGYGIDVLNGDRAANAERIRASAIREPLIRGLDRWVLAYLVLESDPQRIRTLLSLANDADENAVRRQLRYVVMDRSPEEIERYAREMTDEQLADPACLMQIGIRLFNARFYETGAALGERALLLHPDSMELRVLNYNLYARLPEQHLDDAIQHAEAILAMQPENTHAIYGLGDILIQAYNRGMDGERLFQARERFIRLADRRAPDSYDLKIIRAILHHQDGDHEGAMVLLKEATELRPDLWVAWGGVAYDLMNLGRYDEAEVLFLKSLAMDPENPICLFWLSHQYAKQERFEEAERFALRIAMLPSHGGALALGKVYLAQERYDEAIEQFRITFDGDDRTRGYDDPLGEALHRSGRHAEELEQARTAYEKYPMSQVMLGNLVSALIEMKQAEEAEQIAHAAQHVADDNIAAHYWEGRARFERGRVEEAIASYRRALALRDNDLLRHRTIHFHLGVALAGREPEEAVASLRRAVEGGFKDMEQLGAQTALDPLREREDFKQLVAEVGASAKGE